ATDHIYMENNVEIGNPWQHKIQYKKNYVELDTFSNESGFKMNYKFNVDEKGDLSEFINIKLAIERPELWKVYVNGNEIKNESNRFWIDRDFPLMEIGEFLKKGKNEISLVAKRMSIHA